MSKVIIIGAGAVGSVVAHKMATHPDIFPDIVLASRRIEQCNSVAESIKKRFNVTIGTAQVDADDVDATTQLLQKEKPFLLANLALPYQDLHLMEACLNAGVHYLDTANYESPDNAKFEYSWQWDYHDRFAKAGLMALLGSGFDPGVTSVFASYLRKHYFDRIDQLDILDCNGGDHGHPFATNFNPEINIREISAVARHWEQGKWVETPPMSRKVDFNFQDVGARSMYLMYHEEIESLAKHFPEIQRIRFWMTFGDAYIKHLEVLQNIGMTSIEPIQFEGREIIPLQFLKAILPDPATLGATTKGKTNIGDIASGVYQGKPRTCHIFNITDHEACYREMGAQGVAYTAGVPAVVGAAMMLQGHWQGSGVFNVEQMNPDPFMDWLGVAGLPWEIVELDKPLDF